MYSGHYSNDLSDEIDSMSLRTPQFFSHFNALKELMSGYETLNIVLKRVASSWNKL